jgi:hypothetical protein
MSRRLSSPLLLLLLAGCADSAPLRLLGPGEARLQASASTTTEKVPVDIYSFVPCAMGGVGETVHLTGTLRQVTHVTINRNHATYMTHVNPQGLGGVGLSSGLKYRGTGVSKSVLTIGVGQTQTLVENFRLIGQGPGNNLLLHENLHVTVNANGVVTAEHDNFSFECR